MFVMKPFDKPEPPPTEGWDNALDDGHEHEAVWQAGMGREHPFCATCGWTIDPAQFPSPRQVPRGGQ